MGRGDAHAAEGVGRGDGSTFEAAVRAPKSSSKSSDMRLAMFLNCSSGVMPFPRMRSARGKGTAGEDVRAHSRSRSTFEMMVPAYFVRCSRGITAATRMYA